MPDNKDYKNKGIIPSIWSNASKPGKFLIIISFLILVGTILSFVASLTVLSEDTEKRDRIAVFAPLSGAHSKEGKSLANGVQTYVDYYNKSAALNARHLTLDILDSSQPDAGQTAKIIADKRYIGVIGSWPTASGDEQINALSSGGLATVSVTDPVTLSTQQDNIFKLGLPLGEQGRFVANYARNVQQQKLMYVIAENDDIGTALSQPFVDAFERFGIAIRQKWLIPANGDETQQSLTAMVADLKERADVGAVYVAASPILSAKILHAIHESGLHLAMFGPSTMATNSFATEIEALAKEKNNATDIVNGLMVSTPLLWDTANELAQTFNTQYQNTVHGKPDWIAAYGYDATKSLIEALPKGEDTSNHREKVLETLSERNSANKALMGVMGAVWFNKTRMGQTPIEMGVYNGTDLISAPTQLQPINHNTIANYIAELKAGRVLYVNDRFMYKTNVVYVGVRLNEITEVDVDKQSALIDADIWFRYAGDFSPQDIEMVNAVEPVILDKPDAESVYEDTHYRRYHLRQKFFLNFSDTPRSYGSYVAGFGFRHRGLSRSNLLYVSDVLGMPMGDDGLKDILNRHVIKGSSGWSPERAWVSQELVHQNAVGDPKYVGFSALDPSFSRIDVGVLLRPAGLEARDIIPSQYFVYIGIFGILGSLLARTMDFRQWGRYWAVQSWALRVVFWPIMLLSVGNVILDYAFQNLSVQTIRPMVLVYAILWWVIPAILSDMALKRFLWIPLEERTQRRIPNIIIILSTVMIYALALAGIVAFVFNQTLTSLMATSGLFAMIIGLAVQANIANVFSGIILNVERPFQIGDYVKINNVVGKVIDITWRTTRIQANDGQLVSFANGKVSEAEVHNFSVVPLGIDSEMNVFTPPEVSPATVLPILEEVINTCPAVYGRDNPETKPSVRFKGIVSLEGRWVARYTIGFRVSIIPKKATAIHQMSLMIWEKFKAQGIVYDITANQTNFKSLG